MRYTESVRTILLLLFVFVFVLNQTNDEICKMIILCTYEAPKALLRVNDNYTSEENVHKHLINRLKTVREKNESRQYIMLYKPEVTYNDKLRSALRMFYVRAIQVPNAFKGVT